MKLELKTWSQLKLALTVTFVPSVLCSNVLTTLTRMILIYCSPKNVETNKIFSLLNDPS